MPSASIVKRPEPLIPASPPVPLSGTIRNVSLNRSDPVVEATCRKLKVPVAPLIDPSKDSSARYVPVPLSVSYADEKIATDRPDTSPLNVFSNVATLVVSAVRIAVSPRSTGE